MKNLSEKEFAELLRDPALYPHKPSKVELIQTHISFVVIVSPYVYKVKKAVDLGFLDFSSLASRQRFCREEVRLNRRLCPDVYEGVVPISRTEHGLVFERDTNVVEYAVKMRRMRDGRFLHQLVERGQATPRDLERVAERLAAFYLDQCSSPELAEWGRISSLKISTRENFEQVEPFVGDLITAPAFALLREYTNMFFHTKEPLLNRRRAEGHVLDGHGDLRLEHIHLTENAVRIFDCIEFNERLRCIDTANDVAFLAMDLDYHNRPDLASVFVECISRRLSDESLAELLDFYKCYRACVRGKVEGMRSREPEIAVSDRQESRDAAVRYFQLALNYAVTGSKPVVLVIMGRIGSGKSTVARLLSDALGWSLESSDPTRKRLASIPNRQGTGPARQGHADGSGSKALYGEEMTARTYDFLIQNALERARRGRSTILDATFSSRMRRNKLRGKVQADGTRYGFIELTAPESVLKDRLKQRDATSDHASDARLRDFDTINAMYEKPNALEDAHHREVNAERSGEETVQEVLRHLAAYKQA